MMAERDEVLREVRRLEYAWIPSPDGGRLSPDGARERAPLWAEVGVEAESVRVCGAQDRFHIVTHGQMTCDARTLFVVGSVSVREGEPDDACEVFAKTWRHEAPGDLA